MATPYICVLCDQEESRCKCDAKDFCSLCHGDYEIRLCEDGQYYCINCREACDLRVQTMLF